MGDSLIALVAVDVLLCPNLDDPIHFRPHTPIPKYTYSVRTPPNKILRHLRVQISAIDNRQQAVVSDQGGRWTVVVVGTISLIFRIGLSL